MGVEEARGLSSALGTMTPAFLLCVENPMDLDADEMELIHRYRTIDTRGRALLRGVAGLLSTTEPRSASADAAA